MEKLFSTTVFTLKSILGSQFYTVNLTHFLALVIRILDRWTTHILDIKTINLSIKSRRLIKSLDGKIKRISVKCSFHDIIYTFFS